MADKEYCERNALLAEYDRRHKGPPGGARTMIEEFPAANVRPMTKGTWINEKWAELPFGFPLPYCCFATCTVCRRESFVNVKRGIKEWEVASKFCPNCGANMMEAKE